MGSAVRYIGSTTREGRKHSKLVAHPEQSVRLDLGQIEGTEGLGPPPVAAGKGTEPLNRVADPRRIIQDQVQSVTAQQLGIAREEEYPDGNSRGNCSHDRKVTRSRPETRDPERLRCIEGMCSYMPWAGSASGVVSSATRARNSLLGLNTGTGRAATSTGSPVRGFRAIRVFLRRILKVPKPRTSMLCCCLRASLTASRKASTTRAQSFLEIIGPAVFAMEAVTCSTRSALVMHPPGGLCRRSQAGKTMADTTSLPLVCQGVAELISALGAARP